MTSTDSQSKTTGTVLCQDHGNGIYSLQIDAVADQPVLSEAIQQTLLNQLALVQSHADLKVLILQGGEQTFLRGDRNHVNQAITSKLLATLSEFPYPVIAAVEGHATGAGWLVASLCDFMVLNQDSDYGYSVDELFPSPAEQQMFEHRFGYQQATDLLFQTPLMRGAELKAKSWTCAIVDKKQVHTHAHKLAENLAKKPQTALRLLKQHLGRQQFALTQQLNPVDAIAEPTPAKKVKLSSPSKNIALHTEQEHVLTVHIQQAKRSYAVKTLLADLTKLARQINKAPHYKVVILQSDYAEFFSEDNEKIQASQVLALQQWIQSIERPVVCLLNSDSQGKAWLMSQVCDSVIYQQQGSYSLAGVLHDPQLAQPTSALLTYHYGQVVGRELVLSGGVVTGAELQQRCPSVLVANSDQEASTKAQQLAAFLAEYPLAELQAWKQHRVTCLTTLISNLPNWQAGAEAPSDGQVTEVTDIALNTQVIKAKAHPQGIIEVRMEDREAKNMFSEAFTDGMSEVFQHIEANPQYKVVVLTGYDKYFASGGTKAALLAIQDGQTQFTDNKVFQSTWACSIPVIAAMQGHGVGAGLALGLFADITILSSESKFFSPYMQYGFTPGAGANLITPLKFGYDLAKESLLTAHESSGQEFLDRGLRLQVLPRAEVVHRALEIAKVLARQPRSLLVALKQQWNSPINSSLEENYQCELAMHEKTFVGQQETLQQIQTTFNDVAENSLSTEPNQNEGLQPEIVDSVIVNSVQQEYSHVEISAQLKSLLAQELHLEFDEIEEDIQFVDLGLDSITGVTWVRKINDHYGTAIEAAMIYSYPTLTKLSQFVKEQAASNLVMKKDDVVTDETYVADTEVNTRQHVDSALETLESEDVNTQISQADIADSLCQLLAEELHLDMSEIDEDTQFVDLGLDSITGVTWVRKINDRFNTAIEAAMVYSYPTLRKLSEFVFSEVGSYAAPLKETVEQKNISQDIQKGEYPVPQYSATDISETLKSLLSQELHLDESEINEDAQFIDLGLDSITGVTWVRKINDKFATSIEAAMVYSYPTLNKLSAFIQQETVSFVADLPKPTPSRAIKSAKLPRTDNRPVSQTTNTLTPKKELVSLRKTTKDKKGSESVAKSHYVNQPIAIIGMAGQFPKANNLQEYWQNIIDGKNCISEIPKHRWDLDKHYQPGQPQEGKSNCKYAGLLDEYDLFDPRFFDISPAEARSMDPQQRLFLQSCWHTIENAGYNPKSLSGSKCGVFVGSAIGDYNNLSRKMELSAHGFTGCAASILAGRISYILNLQGPSIAIDTACSSSLVAIANACDSLLSGTSDMALAGGAYVSSGPDMHITTSQAGMLSADGRCYTFDQRANGFVPGEGVGVVMLKRLDDAIRDNDIIYAQIEGWGTNQDGKTNGITAPNAESQAALEKEVYRKFNIDPESIQLIEAHGTGTKLGDPIEIIGLKNAFKAFTEKQAYCAIGSVKSNIGHCLLAAGVSGVIKVAMALKHKQLPPTINFDKLNEHINLKGSPFYVNTELSPWDVQGKAQRKAAVSSFGFSGTNAHLVIGEYVPDTQARVFRSQSKLLPEFIFPLSAKTEERLLQKCVDLKDFIEQQKSSLAIDSLAYTLQVGREPMEERLCLVAKNLDQLQELLAKVIEGENPGQVYRGQVRKNKEGISIITQDDDIKESILSKCIESENYAKLAKLWATGILFDWSRLYGGVAPQRIEAPLYPFAKERYWIDVDPSFDDAITGREAKPRTISVSAERYLHPLVHRNTSNLQQQAYTSVFNGSEPAIRGYQVKNAGVGLPAIAQLELLLAALTDATGVDADAITLENILWGELKTVHDQLTLITSIYPSNTENYVEFDICCDDIEHVLCQGQARLNVIPMEKSRDLADLRQRMQSNTYDHNQLKTELANGELIYGEFYRAFGCLNIGKQEALIEVLVEGYEKADYCLHPAILEAVLQAASVINGRSYTSSSLRSLHYYQSISCKTVNIWLRKTNSDDVFDVDIYDARGVVVAQLVGLGVVDVSVRTESVIEAAGQIPGVEASQKLFFKEYWKPESTNDISIRTPNKTLVFGNKEDKSLTHETSTKDFVFIDQPESITNEIIAKAILENTPDTIIYAWSKSKAEQGVLSIFDLFKVIKSSQVTINKVVLVGEYNPVNLTSCWDYSWIGFQRSLKMLLPEVEISIVYLADSALTPVAALDGINSDGAVWYQGSQRFVLSIQETELKEESANSGIKQGGGYLITGGCGAIGFKFASYLAETFNAKVVLLGRSRLSESVQAKLTELKDMGASEAIYICSDVSNKQSLKTQFDALSFNLSGIFHAAGIESAKPFDEKDHAEIKQVLKPKIDGSLLLDEVLELNKPGKAASNLDFICYFSSSSAMLGDFGSCDYAIANRFLMAYAQYRQLNAEYAGKSYVINWPLWAKAANQENGMGLSGSEQTDFYLKSSGQEALQEQDGVQACHDIMTSDLTQSLVMIGKPSRINQFLNRTYHPEKKNPVEEKSVSVMENIASELQETSADKPAYYAKGWKSQYQDLSLNAILSLELKDLVADNLSIAKHQLNDKTNLADYGFDSISLASFARYLSTYFSLNITPALFFNYATIQQLAEYFVNEHHSHMLDFYCQPNAVKSVKPIVRPVALPSVKAPRELLKKRFVSTAKTKFMGNSEHDSVAIVGISGRFPNAKNVNELWQLLAEERSGITQIPSDRWNWRDYFYSPGDIKNTISTNKGGFIHGVDQFDPLFFEISPVEAEEMDPSERLILMEAYRAIEDARISPATLRGSNVGVFVGMEESQYGLITEDQGVTTAGGAMISSRLSYFLDLHGPTIAINTACSSGLVALHQAATALKHGDCESALVAGVSLSLAPKAWAKMSEAGMISQDGECFSFANNANGIGIGESVAVVMIKPLSKAEEDGDHIYGVIKASGINFDGKTNGVTAPNGNMQAKLIEDVYTRNHIDIHDISHIVAHGTGTKLGDPIEINALNDVFKRLNSTGKKSPLGCAITSNKSNLGHTMAVSGLVSLISLLKSIEHHQIPATIHCDVENDYFNWKDSNLYINKKTKSWEKDGTKPHLGAVSAFGRSGTNVHVVIEEYCKQANAVASDSLGRAIIPLSAKAEEQLIQKAKDLIAFITTNEKQGVPLNLAEIAYTLQVGRESMDERLCLVVDSVSDLKQKLTSYVDGMVNLVDAFVGSVHHTSQGVSIISDDDDMREAVNKWVANNKLSKLAQLWVTGFEINWKDLYQHTLPKRIALPTYPFANERYWANTKTDFGHQEKVTGSESSSSDSYAALEAAFDLIEDDTELEAAVGLIKQAL
ncbi:SDR family NAD(P)-dependent oxidoreductase [Teredinibacter sp. KSP-S5-2]|uniref:SDR family NAD(P)-dependent oxidoreductase n=1 Tax=Teredinibacter sp. KSP-S5-2 TaxID=3034506 RepID=UPI0029352E93|nr:SDR family NAD(P)-dependent oxidoreductase [Teredinibacter sp. KSP-S5-2]WNO11560.1 SDR family NAD(P)-dependent oxidoreductase [Teredinibacter sp. KSP-S5-2]